MEDETSNFNQTETNEADSSEIILIRSNQLVLSRVSDLIGFTTNSILMIKIISKENARARHSNRVVQYLIANLALLSNLAVVVNLFSTDKSPQLIAVSAPFCSLVSFLRNVVYTSFSVNIIMVVYERLQSFHNVDDTDLVRTTLLLIVIWTSSLLFNVPSAFMKTGVTEDLENEENSSEILHVSKCKSIPLFGMTEATIFYETVRFLFLHVGVGIYMIYALLEIRSRLKYLTRHSNLSAQRMTQKLNCIRLVYFYLLSFFITQLPIGVIVYHNRVVPRIGSGSVFFTDFVKNLDAILTPALVFHFHMSPLISYLFMEGFNFHCVTWCCQQSQTTTNSNQEDVSRLATYHATEEEPTTGSLPSCNKSMHNANPNKPEMANTIPKSEDPQISEKAYCETSI